MSRIGYANGVLPSELWRRFLVALMNTVGLALAFLLHGCVSEQPPWNYGERVTDTDGTTTFGETTDIRGSTSVGLPPGTSTGVAFGETGSDAGESMDQTSTIGLEGSVSGEVFTDSEESDSSSEAAAVCGNGVVEGDEDCDGRELLGATCRSEGFARGELSCRLNCEFDPLDCEPLPAPPELALDFSAIKQFDFSWSAVEGVDYYQLEESATPSEPFVQLGEDIVGTAVSLTMPLHLRRPALYRLRACSREGWCVYSVSVDVAGSLAEAIGYVKASNTRPSDYFGYSVALSADGNTLAVGAHYEDSSGTGVGGDQAYHDDFRNSGAVYVFVRDGDQWSQQAYVKASNSEGGDFFGVSVALSGDGNTLAVGAFQEDSPATGVGDDQDDIEFFQAGAVYVFVRDGDQWSQQVYVKASNTGESDSFGESLALSGDGNTLAVGAPDEASDATGVDGDQGNDDDFNSGAVYVFVRDGDQWAQQAYVKASNTQLNSFFGRSMALSEDGNTLAVGAPEEDSNATGIGGDQRNDDLPNSGAAYVFVRDGDQWSQQAYVKASNTGENDLFGVSVALSSDGNTLAIGAPEEDSSATGVGDDQDDDVVDSGAAYVFAREGDQWSQQAYVKASNAGQNHNFGASVALSGNGNTLAVGAPYEGGRATGVDGDQGDLTFRPFGAVYVFAREGDQQSQQAYVKASNTGENDFFGTRVALSGDGNMLAVGAPYEGSSATGVGGDQGDHSGFGSAGAVYLY